MSRRGHRPFGAGERTAESRGYAVYGLVAFAITPGWVLWVKDAGLPGLGVGILRLTFINRNSYAAYAGIGLITIYGPSNCVAD
jgi:hypothetical protein